MKIVFLCGSLEPGRDGVGDYTRRLAAELTVQGHPAAVVALNDKHVAEEQVTEQRTEAVAIPVLRLPATWNAHQRFARASAWVAEFNPGWVSLQFVPYAFQAKGLPWQLSTHLRSLVRGRQVHIMFHENWVGSPVGASLKTRLTAALQKTIIRKTLHALRPTVLHTHLPAYHKQIESLGWKIQALPLFSNIPVTSCLPSAPNPTVFRVGIFSQVDASQPFVEFLTKLAEQIEHQGHVLHVLLIGGEPTKMRAFGAMLEGSARLHNRVGYTNFLGSEQVSEALHSCALGLTPVPRHALGKSGSVAAFLAHQVPVAAPNVHPEYTPTDIGFFPASLCSSILLTADTHQLQTAQASAQKAPHAICVSSIARTFVTDLTCAEYE